VLDVDGLVLIAGGDVLRFGERGLGIFGKFVQVHTRIGLFPRLWPFWASIIPFVQDLSRKERRP
jgi:hypothetical protein